MTAGLSCFWEVPRLYFGGSTPPHSFLSFYLFIYFLFEDSLPLGPWPRLVQEVRSAPLDQCDRKEYLGGVRGPWS